jgi:hypothetical protein
LEKRGRIYRSGLVAKGTPQAHRFPRHPAEMIICRTLATYKGRSFLSAPRTDPSEPNSSTRLLPRVFDGEALVGPGVEYARRREPVVGQFRHAIPCEAVLLAASPKRSTPEIGYIMPEC